MIDLDAIEARAKAATPGPWEASEAASDAIIAPAQPLHYDEEARDYGGPIIGESMHLADRDHIAGLDPQTVLALVAELRAAREVVDKARLVLAPSSGDDMGNRFKQLAEAVADYTEAVTE
jgi:hypothetical protein